MSLFLKDVLKGEQVSHVNACLVPSTWRMCCSSCLVQLLCLPLPYPNGHPSEAEEALGDIDHPRG